MSTLTLSKEPQRDETEFNAFLPSPFSLEQFTSDKSDLSGADYPTPYKGSKRILVIGTDERYLELANGTLFSSGNHPIETLVPMYHLSKAGFDFDIATVSGNSVKFEFWAMPSKDEAIVGLHARYHGEFKNPKKLTDVVASLTPDSDYIAVFIPGGHGPLAGLPFSEDVDKIIRWTLDNDRFLISICHGPAAFLASGRSDADKPFPLEGYSITAFPDETDRWAPTIGYMPGHLQWHFGEKLQALGMKILNTEPNGDTHRDRKLLTGASPFAANALGKLAAQALLEEVGHAT